MSNPFTLWCAHKAYIRGIILQTCSREKRQRTQKIDNLLEDIKTLESQNKNVVDIALANQLAKLCSDLRLILIKQYGKHIKSLKLAHYTSDNRGGKFLAQRLKEQKSRIKIPYLICPTDKSKILNPKEIANTCADYYSTLYNLKDDPNTPQPTIFKPSYRTLNCLLCLSRNWHLEIPLSLNLRS